MNLLLLIKYWKEILLGLALAGALAWGLVQKVRADHYLHKVVDLQAKIDDAVIRQQTAEKIAKQRADEITKIHEQSLQRENELIEQNNKLVKDKINANEELKRVKLSLNLVQLWNSSKQPVPAASEAKQGNDGEASRTEATVPLTKFFENAAENDKNHLKCVKQVEDWQSFWQSYVKAKEEADAAAHRRTD